MHARRIIFLKLEKEILIIIDLKGYVQNCFHFNDLWESAFYVKRMCSL
jgi:hypothetical protein